MPRKAVVLASLALPLAAMACSLSVLPFRTTFKVERIETGPTVVEDIRVPLPEGETPPTVEFLVGAGEVDIHPGAEQGLIEGTITYNIETFKPRVTVSENTVRLRQGGEDTSSGYDLTIPDLGDDFENRWDLALSPTPMALIIRAGASHSRVELGGLSVTDLSITQGASDFDLSFGEPNRADMGALRFDAGASSATLSGLSNANASHLVFRGGAGSYTLQFNGELQRDLKVLVEAGLGQVVIIVPEGLAAEADVDGALAEVDAFQSWQRSGSLFTLEGEGPKISFEIGMGLGELELRNR